MLHYLYKVHFVLQYSTKRCLVYGGIVFTWVFMPAYLSTIGVVGTDIVRGTCVPYGVYSSYAAEVAVSSSSVLITYLLPLVLMMYCYIRIVCALKHKVHYALSDVQNTLRCVAKSEQHCTKIWQQLKTVPSTRLLFLRYQNEFGSVVGFRC